MNDLHAALDDLNALWKMAEARLREMKLPKGVEAEGELGKLIWMKHTGEWRICFVLKGLGQSPIPILETKIQIRVDAIDLFRELANKAEQSVVEAIKMLDSSIINFKRVLGI